MSKKIIFMGTPEYAEKILDRLYNQGFDIELVLTQPDKPVGRKKILTSPSVKIKAKELGIEVLQPKTLKDLEIVSKLKSIKPDFIIVAAYGQILPKEILDIAPCINLHASILPKYRGASPIQQALLDGCDYTGVTAMLMNEGLDTGDILAYTMVEIDKNIRLSELTKQLTDDASSLTIDVLNRFSDINPLPQISSEASYCKKITKDDGKIVLDDATYIYNRFRAFENWPGIFLENGLKFTEISLEDSNTFYENRGEILSIDKDSFTISCKKGAIRVFRVHPASKKEIDAKSYLAGKRLKIGDNIL